MGAMVCPSARVCPLLPRSRDPALDRFQASWRSPARPNWHFGTCCRSPLSRSAGACCRSTRPGPDD